MGGEKRAESNHALEYGAWKNADHILMEVKIKRDRWVE
jgi:hypothetical protein